MSLNSNIPLSTMQNEEQLDVNQDITSNSNSNENNNENTKELSIQEKPSDGSSTKVDVPEHEYITGIKLWLVLASVSLAAFLMTLDMSIIATVRFFSP